MSEGPIKRAREAFGKRPPASTNAKSSVHLWEGPGVARGYCGHRTSNLTTVFSEVECSACIAAFEADAEAAHSSAE